jgi:hypothetical protein
LPLYSLPERNFLVRLACLSHAANVRSEPGSNPSIIYIREPVQLVHQFYFTSFYHCNLERLQLLCRASKISYLLTLSKAFCLPQLFNLSKNNLSYEGLFKPPSKVGREYYNTETLCQPTFKRKFYFFSILSNYTHFVGFFRLFSRFWNMLSANY